MATFLDNDKLFGSFVLYRLHLAELVEEGFVGKEEGDGEGEDGGGNTADNHAEHDEEGIDGCYATKEDST